MVGQLASNCADDDEHVNMMPATDRLSSRIVLREGTCGQDVLKHDPLGLVSLKFANHQKFAESCTTTAN